MRCLCHLDHRTIRRNMPMYCDVLCAKLPTGNRGAAQAGVPRPVRSIGYAQALRVTFFVLWERSFRAGDEAVVGSGVSSWGVYRRALRGASRTCSSTPKLVWIQDGSGFLMVGCMERTSGVAKGPLLAFGSSFHLAAPSEKQQMRPLTLKAPPPPPSPKPTSYLGQPQRL